MPNNPPNFDMENINTVLDTAVDEVIKETPHAQANSRDFIERVTNKFIQGKIHAFPGMCDVARVMNIERQKLFRETGIKGKYTDSYGWSEDGTLLSDYDIPQDLYNFMKIFVYKDFWGQSNSRIWRPFMKKVCKGMIDHDAMNLFFKLKHYFGDTNLVKVN